MALNFYTSIIEGVLLYSIVLLLKVLLLVILLKISKKNKYGSKCLKLPKSSREKKLVALSKVSLIRVILNVRLIVTL